MDRAKVKNYILEIMKKAVLITETTDIEVYVLFAGNTKQLDVYGRKSQRRDRIYSKTIYTDRTIQYDDEITIKALEDVIKKLDEILDNNKKIGYEQIKDIISHIDEFHTEAELREELQEILFVCEENLKANEKNKKSNYFRNAIGKIV